MAERIGKILGIDELDIIVIDDPFLKELLAMMKIGDMNIEIMYPLGEGIKKGMFSENGKERAK